VRHARSHADVEHAARAKIPEIAGKRCTAPADGGLDDVSRHLFGARFHTLEQGDLSDG
jgi:hypothetical protein